MKKDKNKKSKQVKNPQKKLKKAQKQLKKLEKERIRVEEAINKILYKYDAKIMKQRDKIDIIQGQIANAPVVDVEDDGPLLTTPKRVVKKTKSKNKKPLSVSSI